MKAFKRIAFSLALTSIVSAFSFVGGASATSPVTPQEPSTNKASISPLSTDGRNISYDFYALEKHIWVGPLPTSTYGTVPLTVVQYTPKWFNDADITYQFSTKDGSKKSSVKEVIGDLESTSKTITFNDVPQGTSDKPVYLVIVNKSGAIAYGNGYTSY